MSIVLFANNATTTIAAPINSGDVTVSLAPGTGALFPAPGANEYFVATFVDVATGELNEIVHVTGVTGDVATIVRAQEGTTALNWSAGDYFNNFFTAGTMSELLQQGQAQQQSTNYAVDTGAADALVITLDPAPSALSGILGAPLRIIVAAANATTTPSLNVNGLGAHTITAFFGAAAVGIPAGTFSAGKIIEVVWDGTQYQYNGEIVVATKAQIEAGTAGMMPMTPAAFVAAFPAADDVGLNGGHIYLRGGYLLQWGNYNSVGSSPITINFSIAFSGTPRVACTATQSSGVLPGTPSVMSMSSITTSAFTVYSCLWNGSTFVNNTGTSFHWHAIGPATLP